MTTDKKLAVRPKLCPDHLINTPTGTEQLIDLEKKKVTEI